MGYGSGSIVGYLDRLRISKARKARRQKEFKGGNDYSNVKSVKTEYNLPKPTSYNLSEFKKKVREEAKLEQKNRILFWIFALVIPLIIIFLVFLYYKF